MTFALRPVRYLPEPGDVLLLAPAVGGDDEAAAGCLLAVRVVAVTRRVIEIEAMEAGDDARLSAVCRRSERAAVSYARAVGECRFDARCKSLRGRGVARACGLTLPPRVERVQRRSDFRLLVHLATRVRDTGSGARVGGENAAIDADLVDLSAGGALLRSPRAIAAGRCVTLGVPTGVDGAWESVAAEVVVCEREAPTGSGVGAAAACRYAVRLRFDNGAGVRLDAATREAIARYLFAQQRIALGVRKLMAATGMGGAGERKRSRGLAGLLAGARARPGGEDGSTSASGASRSTSRP